MKRRVQFLVVLVAFIFPYFCVSRLNALQSATSSQSGDWQIELRRRVAAKDLPGAMACVEERLVATPADLEAQGWRARLLAWTGKWPESEAQYRRVIDAAPHDVDMLTGLSDVLLWQGKNEEALATLGRAKALDSTRAEVEVRRGRALRALGRTDEARVAFANALRLAPQDSEAKAGWESVRPAARNHVVMGADFDLFNYTDNAAALAASWRSDWTSRWSTTIGGAFFNRFGERAGKFSASATHRFTRNDSFTAGGAIAHDNGVIPRHEAFFEYGHGFRFEGKGFVRGLEASYRQNWLWFSSARVLVLTPGALLYFPCDWTWSLSVSSARSQFPGTVAEWRPSGQSRLSFPLHARLSGNVFFAVGTENFARADQVGRFSARTWGGGTRFELNSRQDASFYVFYQDRSQNRAQWGLGFAYGIRF
ncbi:MAG: tetratricopeptide repeat protein [Acidobacteria bacterium]|nr:tetratricopeptide repeat protein [Acidobacteriota bacterium]